MPLETHELDCDILVAGGGAAGVPCALAAARCGASVILCQDRPVLGGNASSEVRMHVVGANGTGSFDRGSELETETREGGIIEEIRLDNCVENPQRSASIFDLILYDKCRTEPNLTLLLNTPVVTARRTDNRIDYVIARRQSTEDEFLIRAKIFVDCTGDGRLGAEARAAFVDGRESKEQFGESLAVDQQDSQRLGSTILLQARLHDRPMPFKAPSWARKFCKDDLRLRLYASPGEEEPTHEYGYWWAEWGGTLDTVKDNEVIRDELLAVARERATTTFHPMGTCRMGPEMDPTAVVDDALRVRGTEGLRVVDASVMPMMLSANLNAGTMMIAEKASDMIRGLDAEEAAELPG